MTRSVENFFMALRLNGYILVKKVLLFLCIGLVAACSTYTKNDNDKLWKIGAKIHFAEDNGSDYLGLKSINKITKDALKSAFGIQNDSAADNAKIMLRKAGDELVMTHYEEKSRPGIGEELHATLLYKPKRLSPFRNVASSMWRPV